MFLESLAQDVRIGLRVLIKEKGFCALAVVVLALGICAVTTQFSVVNGVRLRGFSFPNAERLMSVQFIDPSPAQNNFSGFNNQIFALDYQAIAASQKSFALTSAYLNGSTVNLSYEGSPHRYTGAYVTENFLKILGVAPARGRDFTSADSQPGAEKTALSSHDLWQRDFGGVPDILGKSIRLNGKAATIIGAMPPGCAFPVNEDIWIPLFTEFPPKPRHDRNAQGNAPAVIGLLAGLAASLGLTRYIRSFLFEVHPADPVTFAAVAVALGAVALLACYLPARRATKVDPMVALRAE